MFNFYCIFRQANDLNLIQQVRWKLVRQYVPMAEVLEKLAKMNTNR